MYNKKRRRFIQQSFSCWLGMGINDPKNNFFAVPEPARQLVILHTAGLSARVGSISTAVGEQTDLDKLIDRASEISRIRSEGSPLLLFDTGDIFQPGPTFDLLSNPPEPLAMLFMGYDAAVPGARDLAAGQERLAKKWEKAKFPLVACNYIVTDTPLEQFMHPFIIIQRGGMRVGVTGITWAGSNYSALGDVDRFDFLSPLICLNKTAALLKSRGCELIICLSQLEPFSQEEKFNNAMLAKGSENVDLILGGHSYYPNTAPRTYINKVGKKIVVGQVSWGGQVIGRMDISQPGKGVINR